MTNNMRKIINILFMLLMAVSLQAQGLRHSVCIVEPEYTEQEKAFMSDYSLYLSRAGLNSASRMLGTYKNEGCFGSGVVVTVSNGKYVLTNLHVVGYAQTATVTFQLHDKTLRYAHCRVAQTSPNCDLAMVELPAECEMIALPLYTSEVIDDMSIAAAGFPGLANKPSWQLTRGYVSNARLDLDGRERATHIIQHTASIDPGSSGGPLLFKDEEGKYSIVGINTWKAFYREGVGLAMGTEDILAFEQTMGTPSEPENKALEPLQAMIGEDWLYVFRKLPADAQQSIREADWRLPLDPALRTLAVRDSLVNTDAKEAKQYERTKSHIADLDHNRHFNLIYNNYLGMNQQVGVQFGVDWAGYVSTGIQVTALIMDMQKGSSDSETRAGGMFGVYLGGQVPVAVGKFILAPHILQSAAAGPVKSTDMFDVAIVADTRIGLDWRIPFSSSDLILGAYYDMNWSWIEGKLNGIDANKTGVLSGKFNQYLQHGIGLTIGVGF